MADPPTHTQLTPHRLTPPTPHAADPTHTADPQPALHCHVTVSRDHMIDGRGADEAYLFLAAVKKGRYSHEKRAETIIQSRRYWENLQMQQAGVAGPEYTDLQYSEAQSSAGGALPPLKDVWPLEQAVKKYRKTRAEKVAASATVTTSAPAAPIYEVYTGRYADPASLTLPPGVVLRPESALPPLPPDPVFCVDDRYAYNEAKQEVVQDSQTTDSEPTSPDYIDYSRLGPSVQELVVDGQAPLEGLTSVLAQMQHNVKALKNSDNGNNSESSASDVCQVQIDGLPLAQLFQTFLPHMQNGGGQKMLEQYQQLSAHLSREKCLSFLQTMQQHHQQQQQQMVEDSTSQALAGATPNRSVERTREEASLLDLHETAETLINFAKYPVEKKAVVVEMIPQTSGMAPPQQEQLVYAPQSVSSTVSSGYCTASPMEPYPVDHFEFTTEDKELMRECSTPLEPEEAAMIDKLIQDTFENVEKTKFISDEMVAAIPDIQRKFLVRTQSQIFESSLHTIKQAEFGKPHGVFRTKIVKTKIFISGTKKPKRATIRASRSYFCSGIPSDLP